jgi:hypothetical protein
MKRLDDIDFIWDALDFRWEERFNELLAYKAQSGNTKVPMNWATGLGKWVSQQRVAKKNEKLLPERKKRLIEIEFIW